MGVITNKVLDRRAYIVWKDQEDKQYKTDQQSTQQTDKVLWTPASGKKFVLTDLIISVDTAMTVTIKDGTTTIMVFYLAANGGAVVNLQTPYTSTAANNNLTYSTSTAGNISISVSGFEV